MMSDPGYSESAQRERRAVQDMRARLSQNALWRRLTRTQLSGRLTKYLLGSVVAFVLGNLAFVFCYLVGLGTTTCSVVGFIAAAIPNWILNRRWAWEQTGRPPARQIVGYAGVSVVVLFATSASTGWANHHWHSLSERDGLRLLVVTSTYVLVTVILFFAKFAVYEFWIFSDRSRVRAAIRSLIQVRRIARPNRSP